MEEGQCCCCGKKGHKSFKCRFKDSTPKEEWAIEKAKKAEAEKEKEQTRTETAVQSTQVQDPSTSHLASAWIGAHIDGLDKDLHDHILLDTQASVDLFCNKEIKDVGKTIDTKTSDGVLCTSKQAQVPGYGTVWFSDEAMANIFSMANIEDTYQVEYRQQESKVIVKDRDKEAHF